MGKVKVSTFAREMGMSNDKLLEQLQAAGVNKHSPDQFVNDEDKRQLLGYLRKSHGASEEEEEAGPSKITLKRRSNRQIKQSFSHGRQRTVEVEVRKKRTFVKRRREEEPAEERETVAAETAEAEARGGAQPSSEEAMAAAEVSPQAPEAEAEAEYEVEAPAEAETAPAQAEESGAPQAEAEAAEAETAPAEPAVEQPQPAEAPAPEKETGKRAKKGREGREEEAYEPQEAKEEQGFESKKQRKKREKRAKREGGERRREGKAFEKPAEPQVREVAVPETISVEELSNRLAMKATGLIKQLFSMGVMVTKNDTLDSDTATLVVEELGHRAKHVSEEALEEEALASEKPQGEVRPRPPVVTVMGHVDHGKTSLLDYIRTAKVAAGEAGGITQHIGAYQVGTEAGDLVFLDTPGHEAFTAMRARGAQVTDLVILVVAADDGIKPQTMEAIDHARAAEVPIVVAVNKCDLPEAEPDKVKQEMSQHGLIPEDWGGETLYVNVSAKTGDNVDSLLEMVALQSELLELQAVADGPAHGVVVESKLDRGRGPVATILVREGQLQTGDILLAGPEYGRVRALINEVGDNVEAVGPSMPVEVLGLSGVPEAGDDAQVVTDERKAREISEMRHQRIKDQQIAASKRAKLEGMFEQMQQGEVAELPVLLKADVQGSVEALRESLEKLSTDEVQVKVIHALVGGINESDVNLALASDAIIIGFNVRAEASARRMIEQNGVDVRYFSVIYEAVDQVKAAMSGLLAPEIKEEVTGRAEVRDLFKVPKMGTIAGCQVIDGYITRNAKVRVLRDNVVIYDGNLDSLKRFKDDVKEVREGYECGIGIKDFNDLRVGDQLECYESREIERTLE
ncbi:translation initiation factor IF-2 [Thiohalorhabdus sp.]|uniref:translation initiation factor IF-2 n=1 Tax=Thiohalorhabdus sp. TaxID=3094134 RepID=UPI002FC3C0A0